VAASVRSDAGTSTTGATVLQPWPGDGSLAGCCASGISTGANCEGGCEISGAAGAATVVHLSSGVGATIGSRETGEGTEVNGAVG
jgi:hypothetical protein